MGKRFRCVFIRTHLWAAICGFKFNDLNGNGLRDPGEPGLSNWRIGIKDYTTLTNPTSTEDTTDANGAYCFDNLPTGTTYTLSEQPQAGWTQTFPARIPCTCSSYARRILQRAAHPVLCGE